MTVRNILDPSQACLDWFVEALVDLDVKGQIQQSRGLEIEPLVDYMDGYVSDNDAASESPEPHLARASVEASWLLADISNRCSSGYTMST